jgi:osmotically-inducible protein OsmY
VEVDGHTAMLSGKVRSLAEKEDAMSVAWQAPGIQEVVDNMIIELPESIYEAEL